MFKNLFKNEQKIIAEIHNEFDTAEDRLLEQADTFLKELGLQTETCIEQKAIDLKNLGFINSEPVIKAKHLQDKIVKRTEQFVTTRERAELIRYYKQTYPFQKFLTESELNRICEKYGLIYAPVKHYLKDVPDKNVKELSSINEIKHTDKIGIEYRWKANKTNIEKTCPENVKEVLLGEGVKINYDSSYEITVEISRQFNIPYTQCIKYTSLDHSIVTINKSGLFIAAPKSHFNLNGLEQKGKYAFLNITIAEVKDPIVFRYCRGGVQVLSKWGLEASDESLVNEINN